MSPPTLEISALFGRDDTKYLARIAAEKNIFRHSEDVYCLPEIFHYWSNKHLRPKFEPFGFDSPLEMFRNHVEAQVDRDTTRITSLGSGNCDLEIDIARRLLATGHDNFAIECVDLSPEMLGRGKTAAEAAGVLDHFTFVEADLNTWIPGRECDIFLANQTLHHILGLENLLLGVKQSLNPGGVFLVSDMIGRNGHQRWPEALEIIQEFWRTLPPSYRYNHSLQRYEETFEDFDYSAAGFEGIRARDILPLLLERFQFRTFIGFGNVIDPFVDPAFGPNFDVQSAWDQAFIDMVHERDEAELNAGRIKPTHMVAVLGRAPAGNGEFHGLLSPESCVRETITEDIRPMPCSAHPPQQSAYNWHSWPHSPQTELEKACKLLNEFGRRVRVQSAIADERTSWALRVDQELEQQTERARQLNEQAKELAEPVVERRSELEALAWAKALGSGSRRLSAALFGIMRWLRTSIKAKGRS